MMKMMMMKMMMTIKMMMMMKMMMTMGLYASLLHEFYMVFEGSRPKLEVHMYAADGYLHLFLTYPGGTSFKKTPWGLHPKVF
jgi:hypothetical protein